MNHRDLGSKLRIEYHASDPVLVGLWACTSHDVIRVGIEDWDAPQGCPLVS